MVTLYIGILVALAIDLVGGRLVKWLEVEQHQEEQE